MLAHLATAVAIVFLAACGTSSTGAATRTIPLVPIEPIDISVDAHQSGSSLLVNVTGVGRGHHSAQPIENPDRWHVRATAGGEDLKAVLNGPARVAREPVGHVDSDQWNVTITFSVGFALRNDLLTAQVLVRAPDGQQRETEVSLTPPADETPPEDEQKQTGKSAALR